MHNIRRTARAIVIEDGKVLMFERWRRNIAGQELHYFSIPGGGIEHNEDPTAAVVREMREEMLVTVQPIRLLATQSGENHEHSYFLCEIISGTPQFNPKSEEAIYRAFHRNRYEVCWVPLREAASRVRHGEYRQLLMRLPDLLANPDAGPVDITHSSE